MAEAASPAKGNTLVARTLSWVSLDADTPGRFARRLFSSSFFECILGVVISVQVCVIVVETDQIAADEPPVRWIEITNVLLMVFYVIELFVRLLVYRWKFFRDAWNVLDLVVVVFDLMLFIAAFFGDVQTRVSIFRIFRLARLLRAFKAAKMLKELNHLIRGFLGAVRVIFWGLFMIALILVIFAILAVQLLHPINLEISKTTDLYDGCDRCPHAFESVWMAGLTFFQQVVAGDSWGTLSLPIAEKQPLAAVFFVVVLVVVNLTMLNLILAVIVEAAQAVREEDHAKNAAEAVANLGQLKKQLYELCARMDEDESGFLTREELMNGFDNSAEFARCLQLMDMERHDLDLMFQVLDDDGSGDICYDEFVDQLFRVKQQPWQITLFYVSEVRHRLRTVLSAVGAPAESTRASRRSVHHVSEHGVHGNNVAGDVAAKLFSEADSTPRRSHTPQQVPTPADVTFTSVSSAGSGNGAAAAAHHLEARRRLEQDISSVLTKAHEDLLNAASRLSLHACAMAKAPPDCEGPAGCNAHIPRTLREAEAPLLQLPPTHPPERCVVEVPVASAADGDFVGCHCLNDGGFPRTTSLLPSRTTEPPREAAAAGGAKAGNVSSEVDMSI
eukprot:TRINITY_DN17025_c0_g1_i1.p1 TRINITY_DN17025_c0_g1~~TRINITY_DN17025_c0_g1_i1.p1  ORF type:complete len:644 (+),score=139.18 TRINITY_DN17025_c0_g1_i1:87-1934(+)